MTNNDQLQRINLFFEPDALDILDRYAALTGKSRSYVIRSLFRPAMPTLEALLDQHEAALKAAQEERARIDAHLSKVEDFSRKALNQISGALGADSDAP